MVIHKGQEGDKTMRTLLCILLLVLPICAAAQNPVSISIQPSSQSIKLGEQLGLTVTLKNTNTPSAPVVITVIVKYKDAKNVQQPDATGSGTINISRPVTLTSLALTIPSSLVYVPNTATLNGQTITANQASGVLTMNMSSALSEQQTAIVELKLMLSQTALTGTSTTTQGIQAASPKSMTISVK